VNASAGYSLGKRVGGASARVGVNGHIGSGTNRTDWDVEHHDGSGRTRYERCRLDGSAVGTDTNEEERDGAAIA